MTKEAKILNGVKERNAVKHSMIHRTGPPQPKIIKPNSARFEKSWPTWMDTSALSGKLLSSLQSPAQPLPFLYSPIELPSTISLKSQMSLHPGPCSQNTFYPSPAPNLHIITIYNCIDNCVTLQLNWNNKNSYHEFISISYVQDILLKASDSLIRSMYKKIRNRYYPHFTHEENEC